jgi:hypothetical protein
VGRGGSYLLDLLGSDAGRRGAAAAVAGAGGMGICCCIAAGGWRRRKRRDAKILRSWADRVRRGQSTLLS